MPSRVVTANTTAVEVAAERKNACHYPRSITINNGIAADRTIRIQDILTPDKSAGHPLAWDAQTVERWRATVLSGDLVTFNKKDLKGVKCLGALKVIGDAIDATCYITVGYETK